MTNVLLFLYRLEDTLRVLHKRAGAYPPSWAAGFSWWCWHGKWATVPFLHAWTPVYVRLWLPQLPPYRYVHYAVISSSCALIVCVDSSTIVRLWLPQFPRYRYVHHVVIISSCALIMCADSSIILRLWLPQLPRYRFVHHVFISGSCVL
jgi:hypothetical protein